MLAKEKRRGKNYSITQTKSGGEIPFHRKDCVVKREERKIPNVSKGDTPEGKEEGGWQLMALLEEEASDGKGRRAQLRLPENA